MRRSFGIRPAASARHASPTGRTGTTLVRLGSSLGVVHAAGAAVLLVLALGGCAADGGTGPDDGPAAENGVMRADIDGTAWSAAGSVLVDYFPNGPSQNGSPEITISGSDRNFSHTLLFRLRLRIPAPGTYAVADSRADFVLGSFGQAITWYAFALAEGTSGSVALTTFTSTRAAGTFSFTAVGETATGLKSTVHVTNGSFDVRF